MNGIESVVSVNLSYISKAIVIHRERKQTKRVLTNIYYSPKARTVYLWRL